MQQEDKEGAARFDGERVKHSGNVLHADPGSSKVHGWGDSHCLGEVALATL